MSTTKVMTCTCQHAYQDERYGPGKRVHNEAKGTGGSVVWRCTVCGGVKG